MVTKDIGFVLKRNNFRDTSLIVTFYTLKFGKIMGILKGFYPYKKEFSSPLDVFSLNEIIFYPKKNTIWLVSFADLLDGYPEFKKNIGRNKSASVFLKLINQVLPLWDKNEDVFYLLRDCLGYLKKEKKYKIFYIFLIKFLTISGFKPEFNRCIICNKPLKDEMFFNTSKGGLICGDCTKGVPQSRRITKEASLSFLYIQQHDFPHLLRLKASFGCEEEIIHILKEFILYHLEFDILSGVSLNAR